MNFIKILIMKNISLILMLIACSWAAARGQITITKASFPIAGDSLQLSTDLTVSNIKIAKNGANQIWDFRTLNANTVQVNYFKPANQGTAAAQFPGAELVEKRGTLDYYINVTDDRFEEIGVSGATPEFFNINATTRVSPPRISRRAPLNFFDLNTSTPATTVALSLAALPDSLKVLFGGAAGLIDSIRVKFSSTRNDLVDGYGIVKLPIGDFEVLREKRITYSQTSLEAYLKLTKSWLDISQLLGGQIPAGFQNFLGKDTLFTYNFFAEGVKEPIAIATMDNIDNTKTLEITYKNIKKPISTKDNVENESEENLLNNRPDIKALPNPAIDFVNFELSNLPQGTYKIKVYNLLGTVVWEEQHQVIGNKSIRLDTNHLKKGTYLYSLSDSKGKILATKRLIVLKA
jgi:hypothetical protein